MNSNEKFFMINCEDVPTQEFRYENLNSAIEAAEEISKRSKKEVYILQATQSVKAQFEFIKTNLQDPEDLPF